MVAALRLTKHQGLGNDFLVLLDPTDDQPLTADLATRLCARKTGVGADGVLRAVPGTPGSGAAAVMDLYNADGTRAEMSGNGIRCLAQALLLDGGWTEPPDVVIDTDAGRRTVSLVGRVDAVTHILSVDMGPVRLLGEAPEWAGGLLARATWADVGNPHLVVEVVEPGAGRDELVTLGEKVNATVPDGANVHLVTATSPASLDVRTYERGVGLTEACGTGACASAAVAHAWGLVGDQVTVAMPGGTAQVTLGPSVRLVGPATLVATVEYGLGGEA